MTSNSINKIYEYWLMAGWLYYHGIFEEDMVQSPWEDYNYDEATQLLLEHWDKVDHPLKYLADEEDLRAGTGFAIQYPKEIIEKAKVWKI